MTFTKITEVLPFLIEKALPGLTVINTEGHTDLESLLLEHSKTNEHCYINHTSFNRGETSVSNDSILILNYDIYINSKDDYTEILLKVTSTLNQIWDGAFCILNGVQTKIFMTENGSGFERTASDVWLNIKVDIYV